MLAFQIYRFQVVLQIFLCFSPRVGSPMMSGKLCRKQFSRNSPTDYSSSYLDILRHLQANSVSMAVQNIVEGTLVVDFIRDEGAATSQGITKTRTTMHRIEEPSGNYRGHQWRERRTQARAIADVEATPVALPRSPQVHGKSNKIFLHGDWSPQDDEIQVKLPSQFAENPSREGVNDYIKKFLNGDSIRRHGRAAGLLSNMQPLDFGFSRSLQL